MAFLYGVHIILLHAGGKDAGNGQQPLSCDQRWSQSFLNGTSGVTDHSAPDDGKYAIARISTTRDIFVAMGASPDASKAVGQSRQSTRFLVRAGDDQDFYVEPGDRVAWVDA